MAVSNKNNDQDEIVAEINMTPLIDIMLVLLIIFMVSSSAAIESGMDVNLPEVNAVSDKTDAILVVSLSKTGDVAISGTIIKPEEIMKKNKAIKVESTIKEKPEVLKEVPKEKIVPGTEKVVPKAEALGNPK